MRKAKYLIHTCPERLWYVDDFIIPSMQSQGIAPQNIDVECDHDHIGCLESCMKIFGAMRGSGGTWHLQDDIIIARDFAEKTNAYNDGIVCGFTQSPGKCGLMGWDNMWWSFPCIRIPDEIARECGEWYYSFAKHYAKYWEWVDMGKCDDNMFREFLRRNYPNMPVLNLSPNLVDHVDWLIGGSLVNQYRNTTRIRAAYFNDGDLVDELSLKLESRSKDIE